MSFPLRIPDQLKQHLRALRKSRGLTQGQLGALVGVRQARIAEIEANPGAVSLDQLTKVLAAEWGRYNIQVNCIAPGFIVTDLNRHIWTRDEMKEWLKGCQANPNPGKPEDVAPLAVFLSGCGADYITGQVIAVDGGYSTTAVWPFEP